MSCRWIQFYNIMHGAYGLEVLMKNYETIVNDEREVFY